MSKKNLLTAFTIFAIALALIGLQFYLAFATTWYPSTFNAATFGEFLAPYALLLLAFYQISRARVAFRRSVVVRMLVNVVASYAVAGAAFIIVSIIVFWIAGAAGVAMMFRHFFLIMLGFMVCALPWVNRSLR